MAAYVSSQSYVDFSSKLQEACDWLSGLGVHYSITRLGKYKTLWDKLAELQRSGNVEQLFTEYSFPQWVNAAVESSHVIEIWDGLRKESSESLVDRLRSALRGHELYVLDSDDRSGRDFTFELLVAARFGRSGYRVNFSEAADVEVDFNGALLHVECKRLKSSKQVQKRLKEALKQLHKRYAASAIPSSARGIIGVSISKLVNPSQGVLEGDSPEAISAAASRYVARFINSFQKYWQLGVDRRTLGAVVFLDAPGILLPSKMLWTVNQVGVNNSVPPSSSEYHQLVAIAERALTRQT